jgi:predicted GIY-YIG superfamily endonuclease
MATVYLLRGACGRHYLGSTSDFERRLNEHRRGHTHTTQRLQPPLVVVATKHLDSLDEARELEKKLKAKKNPKIIAYYLSQ